MNKEESKETLRARMQEELHALDPEDRRGRSLQICNHVLELPVWKQARVVVVFEPFKYEPEITPLISDLQRRGSEIIAILPTARSQHDVAIFVDRSCSCRNRIYAQRRQDGTRVWFF
jgi:5-formyltetrahydrofolate cyclo-ligase